jgi:hypothetical protein
VDVINVSMPDKMGTVIANNVMIERNAWCRKHIGKTGVMWAVAVVGLEQTYCFARDEDATLFTLRWM